MFKKTFYFLLIILSTALLSACHRTSDQKSIQFDSSKLNSQITWKEDNMPTPKPTLTKPGMQIDQNKEYSAVLSTDVGDITIKLTADKTPITVNNFVYLAQNGFYDGTIFHRTIKGFMIQGGDPEGNGAGGPGYRFDDEPFAGEYKRGIVAMANAGPNTNGSQFFIMHEDYSLPPNYVIFGYVIKGMDTVDKIATAPTKLNPDSAEKSQPVDPVVVQSVKIVSR